MARLTWSSLLNWSKPALFESYFSALEEKMFGRIIIFDGRNGTVLRWMQTHGKIYWYFQTSLYFESKINSMKSLGNQRLQTKLDTGQPIQIRSLKFLWLLKYNVFDFMS